MSNILKSNSAENSLFAYLPLELYLKILSHLPIKSILNLRATNQHFKCLIDQIESIWRRAYIKLDLDTRQFDLCTKLESTRNTLNSIPLIDLIEIRCAHLLTSQERELIELKPCFLDNEKLYTFRLCLLNTHSIDEYLRLISANCDELIIESFYEPTGKMLMPETPKEFIHKVKKSPKNIIFKLLVFYLKFISF